LLVVASLGGITASCRPPRPCSAVPTSTSEAGPRGDLAAARAATGIGDITGPRCQPSDPACGPIADRGVKWGGRQSGCVVERERLPHDEGPTPSGGACAHDGECVISGCVHCTRWDKQISAISDCQRIAGEDQDKPIVYCGCVASQCDWFRVGSH